MKRAKFNLAETPFVSKAAKCKPRVCTFEIKASVEAEWRKGNPRPLADALVEHMRALGAQLGADYDEQMGKETRMLSLDKNVQ